MASDPNSLANIDEYKCNHLVWHITVDFNENILNCKATLTFECLKDDINKLILDTSNLLIEKVAINNTVVPYEVQKETKPFGQPLHITVGKEQQVSGSTFAVSIEYKTSPSATAVQWLKPEQTLGKKHPYLFTQCQAIHARSLLPCQDSPGIKFKYTAQITVSDCMVALMSAVKGDEINHNDGRKTCHFEQKVPMPSYLLAIAVGNIEHRTVGPRSKVWCEKEMIEACKYEFAEVEKQISTGESLMGPYVWGDYDLLILPPSFPYGGMENPCLTFVTPTVIVGDRSLTSLVAHEITHSWTGNLVTNKTWEHFWLNEGFTRFLEQKIVGLMEGEDMRQLMATDGWQYLKEAIEEFGASNPLTDLQPSLHGIDPDDAFSSVPYEKGYAFLYYIESLVGGPAVFNLFLRSYIDHFKYKTVTTPQFKEYLINYFKDKSTKLSEIDWDAWLHAPGMPPINVNELYDPKPTLACKELCRKWTSVTTSEDLEKFKLEDFTDLSTLQKIDFLTKVSQEKPLSLEVLKTMADTYQLKTYKNSEIKFRFLQLSIRVKWKEMYEVALEFVLQLGRMKFVRPLYREMYKNDETRDLAIKTFEDNRQIYHSITANMVAKDLKLV